MLKGIDNRLNAEVLGCLRAMGHGDYLIVSDTNFPADSIARATVTGRLLRMENLTAAETVNAILSVLPLDTFVDDFAGRMEVVGAARRDSRRCRPRCKRRSRPLASRATMISIERFAFYDLARGAYAVIQTRRAALLRLLHVAQGRHPARRLSRAELSRSAPEVAAGHARHRGPWPAPGRRPGSGRPGGRSPSRDRA